MRLLPERRDGEAAAEEPVRADAKREVDDRLGVEPPRRAHEQPADGVERAARVLGEPEAQRELRDDRGVVLRVVVLRQRRIDPFCRVLDGERVEREIVVRALEGRARRQDHVRVARRLVQVRVDRDHVLERAERAVDARPVRRGEHRVARARDERADLSGPRRLDLLGEHGDRQLASRLLELAHAAPELAVSAAAPRCPRCARRRRPEAST